MRSRWLRPRVAVGRHQGVRSTSHFQGTFLAHLVGGSDRSEVSPTAILQGTHSLVGVFSRKLICLRTRRNTSFSRGGLPDGHDSGRSEGRQAYSKRRVSAPGEQQATRRTADRRP
jgi:hypothetical protein